MFKPSILITALLAPAALAGFLNQGCSEAKISDLNSPSEGADLRSKWVLGASCGGGVAGGFVEECVGNEGGRLVWRKGGNFGTSCEECKVVEGAKMECSCASKGGGPQKSTLDLNEHVIFMDGQQMAMDRLTCDI